MSAEVGIRAWQEGVGAQDTGRSSGLVRGTAGYMRLRKESLVCLFTCHTATDTQLGNKMSSTQTKTC